MPIPFLFIGAGVGLAIAGVGKTVKALRDNSRVISVIRINESTNEKVERAASQLDGPRRECGEALGYLGAEKVYILNNSIREFLYLLEFLENTEMIEWQELNDFNGFCVGRKVIDGLKEMEDFASSLVRGVATEGAGDALITFGAYNAAASTGTAIASLSGVAAQQCNVIRRRIYMFYCLLARLDAYFLPLLGRLKTVIEEEGTDYSAFTPEGQQTVAAAASIAATIKAVLDTPILTEDGNLTSESETVINDVINVLDEEGEKE